MRWTLPACGLMLVVASGSQAAERRPTGVPLEEQLVRHAYMKLMRYQAAAVEDHAVDIGRAPNADEYITFGISEMTHGRIDDIKGKDLAELATPRQGDVFVVTRLSRGEDEGMVTHAGYQVAWVQAAVASTRRITFGNWLQGRSPRAPRLHAFSAYTVAAYLGGERRVYRALALRARTKNGETPPTEIIDLVTPGLTQVLADAAPPIQCLGTTTWPAYASARIPRPRIHSSRNPWLSVHLLSR